MNLVHYISSRCQNSQPYFNFLEHIKHSAIKPICDTPLPGSPASLCRLSLLISNPVVSPPLAWVFLIKCLAMYLWNCGIWKTL